METTESPDYELYSPGQIALAAFLGSPLAACWFWSRNLLRLGSPRSATHCLIWGVVGTVALLVLAFVLPENVPAQIIPAAYTFGFLHAARAAHGDVVARHVAAGGSLGSWWSVVGIGLLCFVVVVAIVFGVVFLLPDVE